MAAPRTGTRIPPGKVWRRETDVLSHELVHLAHPRLTKLIELSRTAQSLEDHVAVQKALAQEAWSARDLDQQVRQRKAELQAELKERKASGDTGRVAQISGMLADYDRTLHANQRVRYAFRTVQDGVIWRLVGFNRHFVSVLGTGTPINYPSASFEGECAAAEEHWKAGRLAVLCDLSNCARTGDLLVLSERELIVTEVKESERVIDETSQTAAARVKVEFLNTGRSEELTEAPLVTATRTPRLKTHLSVLSDLAVKAHRDGFAFTRAGEALAVTLIDGSGISDVETQAAQVIRRRHAFESRLGWPGLDCYEFDSSARLRRDAKDAVASTAPFSIFPPEPETCAALCLGFVAYRVVLNLAILKRSLERGGLVVEVPPRAERAGTFLRIRRGATVLEVRPAHAERLIVELVSLGAFRQMIEAALDAGEDETAEMYHVASQWRGEEQVWR
jgi:hypothetical protein